jgi:hypothetical protein
MLQQSVFTKGAEEPDENLQCIAPIFARPCACEPAQNVRGNILQLLRTYFRARRMK